MVKMEVALETEAKPHSKIQAMDNMYRGNRVGRSRAAVISSKKQQDSIVKLLPFC